jgi:hypothetical protein
MADCLGTTGQAGGTHTAPVPLEYSFALCGWWCPACRRLAYTDEMASRAQDTPERPLPACDLTAGVLHNRYANAGTVSRLAASPGNCERQKP